VIRCLTLVGAFLALGGPCRGQPASPYGLESGREWVLLGTGSALGITSLALAAGIDPFTAEEIALLVWTTFSTDRNVAPYRRTTPPMCCSSRRTHPDAPGFIPDAA
jgi:hypothetical protein